MVILYSWLCPSEIAMPSIQKILDYRSSLFMLSIIGVFCIFGILVYSQESSMYGASVILLQTLYQGQLHAMQDFILYYGFPWILYYGFQHYGFLWVHQLCFAVLLNNSPSQLT